MCNEIFLKMKKFVVTQSDSVVEEIGKLAQSVKAESEMIVKASKTSMLRTLTGMDSSSRSLKESMHAFVELVFSRPENAGKTHGLMIVRCHLPTTEFDRGRWHQDGPYFPQARDTCVWKYATTFFGPGTLFKHRGKVVSTKAGQGVAWKVGCESATMHSEPPFTTPRMFCSLVPCTAEQCKEIHPS